MLPSGCELLSSVPKESLVAQLHSTGTVALHQPVLPSQDIVPVLGHTLELGGGDGVVNSSAFRYTGPTTSYEPVSVI